MKVEKNKQHKKLKFLEDDEAERRVQNADVALQSAPVAAQGVAPLGGNQRLRDVASPVQRLAVALERALAQPVDAVDGGPEAEGRRAERGPSPRLALEPGFGLCGRDRKRRLTAQRQKVVPEKVCDAEGLVCGWPVRSTLFNTSSGINCNASRWRAAALRA